MRSVFTSLEYWHPVVRSNRSFLVFGPLGINQNPDAIIVALLAGFVRSVTPVIAGSLDMCRACLDLTWGNPTKYLRLGEMSVPLKATSYHTTELLLELTHGNSLKEIQDVNKILTHYHRTTVANK